MNWDALSYERWFETPAGRFALEQERRLLEGVVAGWPRRCKTLLEVGCGTGIFLELLYHTGST
jgi:SAM-dependent methyltransferase